MELLTDEEAAERLENLIHFDTQRGSPGIDLTVGEVYELAEAGQLDFGGGEFEQVGSRPLTPELRDEEDDYGWWSLEEGFYLIRYNEGFFPEEGEFGVVRPLPRLLRAGVSHATFQVAEEQPELAALVEVGSKGVEMKENFRASRLEIYRAG